MGLSPAGAAPFHVEIVGEAVGPLGLASGVPINVQRAIDTIETSDIVIVPSVVLGSRWLDEGPLSASGRLAAPDVRARRRAVLGLLGDLSVGRDRAVRRQGRHGAFRLRPDVRGHVSGRADSSRAGADDLGCA